MRLILLIVVILLAASYLAAQSFDSTRARKLSIMHARSSPEWVRDGIIYEIYPRSFSPEGTFAGIEKKLPELKQLGVTILWLMPIHPVGEVKRKGTLGSPYSVQDYYGINPEYGTMDDFKRLLHRAHVLGFHLIIDLVANHTSWDSKLIKEHPDWFTKDSTGKIISPNPDWTDVADLDYSHHELWQYMIDMMKYWVRDVGIDGFRCDVSELVPLPFWEEARAALDSIKPVMMLSEGSDPAQHVKAFDVTYSWNIYDILSPMMTGKLTAYALDKELNREEVTFPQGSLRMRFSSNHDKNAWDNPDVVKFGEEGAKLAAVIVNTIPGIPLIYDGQEIGNPKKLSLFEKTPINWKGGDDFRKFYTRLFEIRREHPALRDGKMLRIPTYNDRYVYAFERIAGSDTILVVYNFSKFNAMITLDFSGPKLSIGKQIHLAEVFTGDMWDISVSPEKSIPVIVPAMGYRVYVVNE